MQCLVWQKLSLNLFWMDTYIYSLKNGVRGGVFCIFYNKVDFKYLKADDPKQESKHYILIHE